MNSKATKISCSTIRKKKWNNKKANFLQNVLRHENGEAVLSLDIRIRYIPEFEWMRLNEKGRGELVRLPEWSNNNKKNFFYLNLDFQINLFILMVHIGIEISGIVAQFDAEVLFPSLLFPSIVNLVMLATYLYFCH